VGSLRFFWVTAQVDHAEHAVTDEAHVRGVVAGEGLFEALCGVVFLVASMNTAPHSACPRCLVFVRTHTQMRDIPDHAGQRRPSRFARLWRNRKHPTPTNAN
jgi:hypothetical protein